MECEGCEFFAWSEVRIGIWIGIDDNDRKEKRMTRKEDGEERGEEGKGRGLCRG
jgi:hypothetical protein